jgi:hypothetical protein
MPEADIPSELIIEQLEEEDAQTDRFDPYIGNLLATSVQQTSVDAAGGFIAFPMGEAMNELSAYPHGKIQQYERSTCIDVSLLKISRQKGVAIKPAVNYNRVFQTPIQQLVSAPLGTGECFTRLTKLMVLISCRRPCACGSNL